MSQNKKKQTDHFTNYMNGSLSYKQFINTENLIIYQKENLIHI